MCYSYEEEIARLRQQLEQAQGRGGNGNVPTASTPTHRSQAPHTPTTASMHQSTESPVPPPPNLGPSSSNYFGDIMSTSSGSGSAPTTAAVATSQPPPPPPHEQQQQQYSGYPPYHHQQQHPPPPPTSMGYTNGSSPRISAPPHSSHVPQGMDRSIFTHTTYIHYLIQHVIHSRYVWWSYAYLTSTWTLFSSTRPP